MESAQQQFLELSLFGVEEILIIFQLFLYKYKRTIYLIMMMEFIQQVLILILGEQITQRIISIIDQNGITIGEVVNFGNIL